MSQILDLAVRFCQLGAKEGFGSENFPSKKIFWGVGVFEEPFCASWVFEDGELKKTEGYIPEYYITTGNSRMKNFTVAIKGFN